MSEINNRLEKLRSAMQLRGIHALIIPSNDPHQSEYVADHWKTREYFSGFSGSAGYLVVLADYAALWTDSRYFLQAENELAGTEVKLHKQVVPHAPEHEDWLAEKLGTGKVVGIEGLLFSMGQFEHLENVLTPAGIDIKNVDGIADEVWEDRPLKPESQVFEHELTYAGRSREEKLALIRSKFAGADYYLATALDEIAWVLNIRAADIACTPVALSYLLIGKDECHWFIEPEKVPVHIQAKMEKANVHIHPYAEVTSYIEHLPETSTTHVDLAGLSWSLKGSFKGKLVLGESLIQWEMAVKTEVEVNHIRHAMAKDAVALTRLFMWLEKEVQQRAIKETEVAKKVAEFRSEQPGYQEESFPAIVGYKANGAIVHYFAQEDTCAEIKNEGMLLIDSGGQYVDGTTDITRTICFGEPTAEQKRHFTNVLKGHITLALQRFPEGTTGIQLDTLARMHLWNEGLNYGHGTGHGVGYFLRVHEPPQGFVASTVTSRGTTGFVPGLFTSNEPGFYKTGAYGIRIENLILCVADVENEYGKFVRHQPLTVFPIETKLIDFSMLTPKEKDWLNAYHQNVFDAVSPLLQGEELEWMRKMCKPV